MNRRTKQNGNTLALILVAIGIVLVLVAFFVLNYNQFMGGHKQAVSAIDAAALACAKDASRVVVDGPLGRIGLVDDTAAFDPPTGGTADARPIVGINTMMATLRLDALIASSLQTAPNGPNDPGDNNAPSAPNGNTSILFLVQEDLTNAQQAETQLASALTGTGQLKDKYGIPIDIQGDTNNAYWENNRSLTRNGNGQPTVTITYGYVNTSSVTSNTPTPQPSTADPVMGGATMYPCYQNFAAAKSGPGANLQFQFVPIANNFALIPNDQFSTTAPTGAFAKLPTAVQVSTTQTVTTMSKVGKTGNSDASTNLTVTASAIAGGTQLPAASGTLVVSFASGGLPGIQSAHQVGATAAQLNGALSSGNTGVDFSSVATIMNGATQDAKTGNITSDGGWSPASVSPGVWFKANGGPVPGSGSIIAAPFKGIDSQPLANPSVSLSFLVYDWLKSLQLRPNVTSVVNALTFANGNPQSFYTLENQIVNGSSSSPTQYTFSADNSFVEQKENKLASNSWGWMPPAYADSTPSLPKGIINGLLDISYGNAKKDRRNLLSYSNNPSAYQRQQSNVWGYVPADPIIPDLARVVRVTDGNVTTTDGNPVSAIYDFWNVLVDVGKYGTQTQSSAYDLLKQKVDQLNGGDAAYLSAYKNVSQLEQQKRQLQANNAGQDQVTQVKSQIQSAQQTLDAEVMKNGDAALNQMPRVKAALFNARYCLSVGSSIAKNLKTLTSMGVKELSPTHFVVAGADFYPPTQGALASQISGSGPCPSGQDKSAPNADWCTPLVGNKSQMDFYKHGQNPVIGARHHLEDGFSQPAYALSSSAQNPYDTLRFAFFVEGSAPGTGVVQLSIGQNPFAGESDLSGQALYQDVHALVSNTQTTNVSGQPVTTSTVWQVQARDQNANAFSSSGSGADYFADMSLTYGSKSSGSSANWCNSSQSSSQSNYPSCPALASEWQLTCPMPAATVPTTGGIYLPPPFTYSPTLPPYSNTSVSRTTTGGTTTTYGGTNDGCIWTPETFVTTSTATRTTVTTNTFSGQEQYWGMPGFNLYQGAGRSAISGEGWSIMPTPILGTYSSSSSSSMSYTYSQQVYVGVGEMHS
jgi:hypothetical protein